MTVLDQSHGRRKERVLLCIAVILLLGASLTACGSDTSNGGAFDLTETTPPAKGDVDSFTWDLPFGESISLDPLKAYNYSENTVLGNACEALLSIAPDFSVQPRLAQSVNRPSPNVWAYKIRSGIKFWDGAPLTVDDVVYSIKRHLDPANGSFYLTPFAKNIQDVRAVGTDTVQVTTKTPSVLTNEMMATGLGTVGEAKYIAATGKSYGTPSGGLMCTGPFEFDKWEPGQSITLIRNDDYWDAKNQAHAQSVQFRFVDDQTALTNALLSGEIDGTYEAPANSVDQLRNTDAGHLYLGPAVNNFSLFMTLTGIRGPMQDLRARQGLSMAIDRAGIAKTAYAGAAEPLRSSLILPLDYPFESQQFTDAYESFPEPTQDLDKATQLIEEAGASGGPPMTLAIQAADPRSTLTANAIVDEAKQVDLPIEIKEVPAADFANFFFDPASRNQYDLVLEDNFGDFADPLQFLAYAAEPGVQNFTNYRNPEVTRLFNAAQNTGNDQAQRAKLTIEAVKKFQDDLQIIPLLYTPERLFIGSDLTGAPATFPYQYYPWASSVGASGG